MVETDNGWGFFVDLEKGHELNKNKFRKIVNHKIVCKYIPKTTLCAIQEHEERVGSFKTDENNSTKEPNNFFMRVAIMIAGITISSMLVIYKVV